MKIDPNCLFENLDNNSKKLNYSGLWQEQNILKKIEKLDGWGKLSV